MLFGLGLAGAVLLDALVIRMALVPGLMLLTGKANWWLPGWLDRALPHLNVEGDAHDGPQPHAQERSHKRAPIGDPAPADGPA
jgi:putative drug exporter of the RND superfamily